MTGVPGSSFGSGLSTEKGAEMCVASLGDRLAPRSGASGCISAEQGGGKWPGALTWCPPHQRLGGGRGPSGDLRAAGRGRGPFLPFPGQASAGGDGGLSPQEPGGLRCLCPGLEVGAPPWRTGRLCLGTPTFEALPGRASSDQPAGTWKGLTLKAAPEASWSGRGQPRASHPRGHRRDHT